MSLLLYNNFHFVAQQCLCSWATILSCLRNNLVVLAQEELKQIKKRSIVQKKNPEVLRDFFYLF
jgi:hypothetical protein